MFCSKGEIFGHWDCDWQYTWIELKEPPTVTAKGIQVLLRVRVRTVSKQFLCVPSVASCRKFSVGISFDSRPECRALVIQMS